VYKNLAPGPTGGAKDDKLQPRLTYRWRCDTSFFDEQPKLGRELPDFLPCGIAD
jgi:hypothetical protein